MLIYVTTQPTNLAFNALTQVTPVKRLTDREQEILRLIVEEFTTMEIALKLDISLRTVDTHRKNISKKLGTKSLIGFTKYAIRQGWLNNYNYR